MRDIRPDKRDRIDFEADDDVVCNSSDRFGVVVVVDLSFDLEGTFDELCRRVGSDGYMRTDSRELDQLPVEGTCPESP